MKYRYKEIKMYNKLTEVVIVTLVLGLLPTGNHQIFSPRWTLTIYVQLDAMNKKFPAPYLMERSSLLSLSPIPQARVFSRMHSNQLGYLWSVPLLSISNLFICVYLMLGHLVMKKRKICDVIEQNSFDYRSVFTETWLRPDNSSAHQNGDITPIGFSLHHRITSSRKGGGVGVLLKAKLKGKHLPHTSYRSVEHKRLSITAYI